MNYGGPPPGQQVQYVQQAPRQKKDRGCLGSCLAILCCCFVCEEGCECCADCTLLMRTTLPCVLRQWLTVIPLQAASALRIAVKRHPLQEMNTGGDAMQMMVVCGCSVHGRQRHGQDWWCKIMKRRMYALEGHDIPDDALFCVYILVIT